MNVFIVFESISNISEELKIVIFVSLEMSCHIFAISPTPNLKLSLRFKSFTASQRLDMASFTIEPECFESIGMRLWFC